MKNLFLILLLALGMNISAQVAINTDGSAADNSAILDVKATNKGLLPPRMTISQMNAIVNPAPGLIIFCTDCSTDGAGSMAMFMNGMWYLLNATCLKPPSPVAGVQIPAFNQVIWNWNTVSGASGYKWNITNDYATAIDKGTATSNTEIGLVCNNVYTRYAWAYSACGNSAPVTLTQITSFNPPTPPTAGTQVPLPIQIVWNWNTVANATGYKWSAVNNYAGATDMGTTTTNTETGLICNTSYTRYAWAYSACGNSTPVTLSQSTSLNPPAAPTAGTQVPSPIQIVWNWNTVAGATGYKWNTTNDFASATDMAALTTKTETGLTCNTAYTRYAWAYSACGNSTPVTLTQATSLNPPTTPTAGTQVPSPIQIVWNWNTVAGATGYKWNTTNDFASATDMAALTTKTETGLTCNTAYTRYAWAYNACGNSTALSMSQATSACPSFSCGNSLVINHLVAGGVAPVDKTTTYGTVTNIPGETTKCWITSNLGADHQATAVNDATEPTAGWYWQFNRKQGYKHDGTTRTPNTTWITSISETSDWITANDPCAIELGTGWRIPTYTEWYDVDNTGGWTTWTGPWISGLKLHTAGFLIPSNGFLIVRGSYGYYWSSTQNNASNGNSFYLDFNIDHSYTNDLQKAYGFPVRCVQDNSVTSTTPTVTTSSVTTITQTTATGGGNVTADGGATVSVRGVCWGIATGPLATGSHTTDAGTTGSFTSSLTGLSPGTLYYVRAYATNSVGTAYGAEVSFTTSSSGTFSCGSSLTVNHLVSGGVAPVDKTTTYGTVTNIPGELTKCWITSNLGADHQATAVDDATEPSAGWYWQFNRKQGYKHDGTSRTPNSTWITSISETSDWITANDPCAIELGTGWRIPSSTEWYNVDYIGGWTNWTGPWNSGLKIHAAGKLNNSDASLYNRGTQGFYWSSAQWAPMNNDYGWAFYSHSSASDYGGFSKAMGYSLRCILDNPTTSTTPTVTTSSVTNTTQTTATGGGNVTADGEATITARGVCWSTTTGPVATGNHTTDVGTTGSYTSSLTGLTAGTLYYVRAYATNSVGTAYGAEVSFTTSSSGTFSCGSSFTINHLVSGGVAPVDKSVTYGTVTNIPGETTKCWITSNLGADHQATAVDDATEPSAGWYWQFNLKQGYKHDGTTRTPNSTWITPINENLDWQTTNDPCTFELGAGWRIPTSTEWTNVNSVGGWTTWTDPWGSGLKLHAAGYLSSIDGSPYNRGSGGHYWSSTQYSPYNGRRLFFSSGNCYMDFINKPYGFSLRCLENNPVTSTTPTVTTSSVTTITQTTATGGGNVTADGGATVSVRGVCWGIATGPLATGSHTTDAGTTGSFTSSLTGLTAGTPYYVRAYATNSVGTAYGAEVTFTTLPVLLLPTLTTSAITAITQTTATGGGNVTADGGAIVNARGVCWSTTTGPVATGNHTTDAGTTGSYTSSITGLTAGTLYYVRAYATNSLGAAYGAEVSFTTSSSGTFSCGSSITINHVVGIVAPVTKSVTYGTVTNIPGELTKCWITSNLGADHQATAVDDATEPSAGWYWQFNRKQGYKHDGTTRTPNTTWISSISETSDWTAVSDPCALELGTGWHIPTSTEWTNVDAAGNWTNWSGSWNSGLKLHAAGYLNYTDGSLVTPGSYGFYWSGTQQGYNYGNHLYFHSGYCGMDYGSFKASGFVTRCIKDATLTSTTPTVTTSSVTTITQTTAISGGNVTADGGATITARGVCWSTTTGPVATGNHTTDAGTTGSYTSSLTGLTAGTLYYVRAYAINSVGTSYGNEISFTTQAMPCGSPFTDSRDGKIYNTVLIGAQCWMAQNLNVGTMVNGSIAQTNNTAIEKYCLNNMESNCDIYGGLYQWAETVQYLNGATNTTSWNPVPTSNVTGLCPTGWHLPTDGEWTTLTTYLGGASIAGGLLMETGTTHWWSPNTGATNSSGFTALPGGFYNDGSFGGMGSDGFWWPSSEVSSATAWYRNMNYNNGVNRTYDDKALGFSVRCLRD